MSRRETPRRARSGSTTRTPPTASPRRPDHLRSRCPNSSPRPARCAIGWSPNATAGRPNGPRWRRQGSQRALQIERELTAEAARERALAKARLEQDRGEGEDRPLKAPAAGPMGAQSGADDLGQARRAQRDRQGARGASARRPRACGSVRIGRARRRARPSSRLAVSRAWNRRPTWPASGGRSSGRSSARTSGSPRRRGPSTTCASPRSSASARFSVPTKSPDETRFHPRRRAAGPRGAAAVPDPRAPAGGRASQQVPRPNNRPGLHPRPLKERSSP